MKLKVIRFQKKRKYKSKLLSIVVIFKKVKPSSFYFEKIGYLNLMHPKIFAINLMRLGFWLNKGVKLHKSVKKYLLKLAYV